MKITSIIMMIMSVVVGGPLYGAKKVATLPGVLKVWQGIPIGTMLAADKNTEVKKLIDQGAAYEDATSLPTEIAIVNQPDATGVCAWNNGNYKKWAQFINNLCSAATLQEAHDANIQIDNMLHFKRSDKFVRLLKKIKQEISGKVAQHKAAPVAVPVVATVAAPVPAAHRPTITPAADTFPLMRCLMAWKQIADSTVDLRLEEVIELGGAPRGISKLPPSSFYTGDNKFFIVKSAGGWSTAQDLDNWVTFIKNLYEGLSYENCEEAMRYIESIYNDLTENHVLTMRKFAQVLDQIKKDLLAIQKKLSAPVQLPGTKPLAAPAQETAIVAPVAKPKPLVIEEKPISELGLQKFWQGKTRVETDLDDGTRTYALEENLIFKDDKSGVYTVINIKPFDAEKLSALRQLLIQGPIDQSLLERNNIATESGLGRIWEEKNWIRSNKMRFGSNTEFGKLLVDLLEEGSYKEVGSQYKDAEKKFLQSAYPKLTVLEGALRTAASVVSGLQVGAQGAWFVLKGAASLTSTAAGGVAQVVTAVAAHVPEKSPTPAIPVRAELEVSLETLNVKLQSVLGQVSALKQQLGRLYGVLRPVDDVD